MAQSSSPSRASALSHLKVLDLSRILAGPWSTQVLADLGAEVIKVENPNGGDDTRAWGPPFVTNPDGTQGDAAYFTSCNRNKRSITVDFSKPEGADLVRRLAERADIVIENFKVGGLAKYGLDYKALKTVNPQIIYCSITGFGQTGPYADRAGYDFLIQGMGGVMSVTGQPEGTPGNEPMKVGTAVCDLFTSMYATVSVLAAVTHRDQTGEGQYIDCSLFDSQIAMMVNQNANWLVGGQVPTRMGNHHPNIVPYTVFPTKDGHIIIACGNDGQYLRLCEVLEAGDLATDGRFKTNADRIANRVILNKALAEHTSKHLKNKLLPILEKNNVPCGPINTVPEVFDDPHTQAREMANVLTRGDGLQIPGVGFPAKFSETPAVYHTAPPKLGADTTNVLSQMLGLNGEQIDDLKKKSII